MAEATFRIVAWMACGDDLAADSREIGFLRGTAPQLQGARAEAPRLPTLLRRRVSTIGQRAFESASGASGLETARFVFSSRHGEFSRTLSLLETLARKEPLSPADFSLSVHNALIGLLSIAVKNEAGHTAMSGSADSFGFALVEAAACLKARPEEPICLIYGDEPLSGIYRALGDPDETSLAVSLLLAPASGEAGDITVGFEPAVQRGSAPAASRQALEFVRFLTSGRREGCAVGERMLWRWRHAA